MKIIDKVKFNDKYFKENLNVKDLCKTLPYTEDVVGAVLFAVAFDQSIPEQTSDYIDDQYIEIANRSKLRENKNFFERLDKMDRLGTLLPYLSKNFELVIHYNFVTWVSNLIYSKIDKSYYYINTWYRWKYLKSTQNLIFHFQQVPKVFKKKPSPRMFFKEILKYETKHLSKEEIENRKKNYHFETTEGINLWELYKQKKGIMVK